MIRTAVGKILTVKAAAVLAATAIGGVAVAAGTGSLPTQHRDDAAARRTHASQPARPAHPAQPAHPTGAPATSPGSTRAHTATPAPSLIGLCRAFAAGAGDNPGKALDNPAFTALLTAAGGRDKVTAYCTTGSGAGTRRTRS